MFRNGVLICQPWIFMISGFLSGNALLPTRCQGIAPERTICCQYRLGMLDDVIKWKYFRHYWPFARGIHRSPCSGFSPQRPVTRSFDVLFDLRLNKRLSNNRDASDLRRRCTHYDVTVMALWNFKWRLEIHWSFVFRICVSAQALAMLWLGAEPDPIMIRIL